MLWSAVGTGATISTAQFKFGSASFSSIAGVNNQIGSAVLNRFEPGTGDFTVEFWYRPTSFANWRGLFSTNGGWNSNAADGGICLLVGAAGASRLGFWINGAELATRVANPFTLNTWAHVAIVRSGTTVTIWVNGASVMTGTSAANIHVYRTWFGTEPSQYGAGIAHFDELRITNGVARYTAPFAVPTAAFDLVGDPYAANVVALLHFEGTNGSQVFTDEIPYVPATPSSTGFYPDNFQVQAPGAYNVNLNNVYGPRRTYNKIRAINVHLGDPAPKGAGSGLTNPISCFIEGVTVKNGLPLKDVRVSLDTYFQAHVNSVRTYDDGKFIFHHLAPQEMLYEARATPYNDEPHNSIIWGKLTAIPYEISVSGKFVQNSGTGTVDSTVRIDSGLGPFTVTLDSGTLPPGTSISLNDRDISIVGSTTFTGNYIFRLKVEGNTGYSPARYFDFELTPPSVNSLGVFQTYSGETFSGASNIVTLLQFEAPNGSTYAVDSYPSNNKPIWTFGSTAVISSAQAKFGSTSLNVPGAATTSWVWAEKTSNYPDFNWGSDDWTIECWVYMTAYPTSGSFYFILSRDRTNGNRDWRFHITNTGILQMTVRNTAGVDVTAASGSSVPLNQWAHVAATRYGNKMAVFVNGVRNEIDVTGMTMVDNSSTGGNNGLIIGAANGVPTITLFKGYIDQVLILKSAARYTGASFTPDTTPLNALIT